MSEMRDNLLDFRTCLTRIHVATGNVEASFASKLPATLNPTLPVLESVVLGLVTVKTLPACLIAAACVGRREVVT
jgi:hypothetical protein